MKSQDRFEVLEVGIKGAQHTKKCNIYNVNTSISAYVKPACVVYNKLCKYKIVRLQSEMPELNNQLVSIREIQQHPCKETLVHLDCYLIDKNFKNLRIRLPIKYIGTNAPIFKLNTTLYKTYYIDVKVESLEYLVPYIEVDVSHMKGDTTQRQNSIPLPQGISISRIDNIDVCTMHSKE